MPEPPLGRKAATELEVRLSAGDLSAVGPLVDLLDGPLHASLLGEFPTLLSKDDREDLIADFIADMVEDPTRYKSERASIERFAKKCVRNKAIDLLRRRDTQRQYEMGRGLAGALSLSPSSPLDDLERQIAIERARVALESMPANHQSAALAYHQFGKQRYAAALGAALEVPSATVSKWMQRVREGLEIATGVKFYDED